MRLRLLRWGLLRLRLLRSRLLKWRLVRLDGGYLDGDYPVEGFANSFFLGNLTPKILYRNLKSWYNGTGGIRLKVTLNEMFICSQSFWICLL